MFNWQNVSLETIATAIPAQRITTAELEKKLQILYKNLNIPNNYIEILSGIKERCWWAEDASVSTGATLAGQKALEMSGVDPAQVQTLHYAGVCREYFEPATACRVASNLKIGGQVQVCDVSNACLGVLNSMVAIANQIELRQITCGMVVACESARQITTKMIAAMHARQDLDFFRNSCAVLTGGSGAVALLLTHTSLASAASHRLLGGVAGSDPQFHNLCHWGVDAQGNESLVLDSASIFKHGLNISERTFNHYLNHLRISRPQLDKVICHQVSQKHNHGVLAQLDIPPAKNYNTYAHLGNIGAVSLPLTAAFADEAGFLRRGDFVSFLGIGSGFNTVMLGLRW